MRLPSQQIRKLCDVVEPSIPMISPFIGKEVRDVNGDKVLSYGLGPAGYDVRLSSKIKLMTYDSGELYRPLISIDIKDPNNAQHFEEVDLAMYGNKYIMEPGEFILGVSEEVITLPNDIAATCIGKSTYARYGVHILTTPINPGFSGQVVIEIANLGRHPVTIYAGEGIAQFQFDWLSEPTEYPYRGSYQDQRGVQEGKV